MFLDLIPKMMYTKFKPYLTIFEGSYFFGESHDEFETDKMAKCHTWDTNAVMGCQIFNFLEIFAEFYGLSH